MSSLILDCLNNIPTDWSFLDKGISNTQIKQSVETAAAYADLGIASLQQSTQFANQTAQSWFKSLLDSTEMRTGLNYAVWAPGWIMIVLSLLGLMLGSCKGALVFMNSPLLQPGGIGHCVHWSAFVCGALWVSFIALPLFAATSLVSVPLSDLCELIPASGGDASSLITILSRTSVVDSAVAQPDTYLVDALRRCMLISNGSFLNSTAAGLLLPNAFDSLRTWNRIPNATAAKLLSATVQTAPLTPALGEIQDPSSRGHFISRHNLAIDGSIIREFFCQLPADSQGFIA